VFAVELPEPHDGCSFDDAERDSLVAQSDDAQSRVRGKPDEVARVDLNLEAAVVVGGDGIALDERIIQPEWFPILVAVPFQINLAADQADADDTRFYVVIVFIVVVGAGSNCYGEEGE
jgi:hypothetical protein